MARSLRIKLAALALTGGLTSVATAQPSASPSLEPQPQIIRWNGGYMLRDYKGNMVIRQTGEPGTSANYIRGSGNGIGNRVVIGNGTRNGVSIVQNSRLGIGNKIIVNSDHDLLDIADLSQELFGLSIPRVAPQVAPINPAVIPLAVNPQRPVPRGQPQAANPLTYRGKENPFWSKKSFSEAHDCNLYWSPNDQTWFRYSKDDDTYHAVNDSLPAPQN